MRPFRPIRLDQRLTALGAKIGLDVLRPNRVRDDPSRRHDIGEETVVRSAVRALVLAERAALDIRDFADQQCDVGPGDGHEFVRGKFEFLLADRTRKTQRRARAPHPSRPAPDARTEDHDDPERSDRDSDGEDE